MNKFIWINTLEKLKEFQKDFKSKEFAFDTEFTTLRMYEARLIGLSIFDPRTGLDSAFIQFNFYYDYTKKVKEGKKSIDKVFRYEKTDAINVEDALPILKEMFMGAKCICASAKVEWKISMKYGFNNWIIGDDVNLMSWLLNVDEPSDLKWNTKKELQIDMPSYTDTIGQKPNNIDWTGVDWYEYAKYGARDAYATYYLRDVFLPRIEQFPSLLSCYRDLELPLLYVVADSEMRGVTIDVEVLEEMSRQADTEIQKAQNDIYDTVGIEFNIGSGKQLAEVLFDRMGCPSQKVSEKTGARSTDEGVMKELAFQGYEIADDILDYRKLTKLKSTYLDGIPKLVDADGRLRGSFNQSGTVTGRFSSSQPNLQNQPNNKKFPVKAAFVPRKGYKFLVFDWSTIEIRIMAYESGCPIMTELLRAGRDIHAETQMSVNNLCGLNLSRGQGKTINFGVLYLMGADSLSYMLNKQLKTDYKDGKMTYAEYKAHYVTKEIAQKIIDGYFQTYTGFTQYVKDVTHFAKSDGWVWTLGGRRRPIPELKRKGKGMFGAGQRKAVNTPIQGGAADLMKRALVLLFNMYLEKEYDAATLLYVHDEFVIECREDQAEACAADVKELIENIFPQCTVPILCDGGIYDNWAGLKQGNINLHAAPKQKEVSVVNKLINYGLWQRR